LRIDYSRMLETQFAFRHPFSKSLADQERIAALHRPMQG
jgi:hypothetical protein